MPHLSKQSYAFSFMSDALMAALAFERSTTEFYRYETRYIYDTKLGDVVEVRVLEQDGVFVGYVAGEA
uniref:Uncharacterized protein n=1 Tax=Caulobacter phage BL57 TaxID=3348355 RepID=A0AB74UKX5_9VIRU